MKIRVVIAEDQAMVRDALERDGSHGTQLRIRVPV